ncbi:MAG: prolyl oligopeptidase family protein [bacterium]
MQAKRSIKFLLTTLFIIALVLGLNAQGLKYPEARKANVIEDYHGTKVADPYRWMEDPESPETLAFVNAQNQLTFDYVRSFPFREKIKKRLTELLNYPKYSAPRKVGDRYFYSKNDGLQNQSVVYMQKKLGGESQIVIDPNKLSADGTVALTNQVYSKDGKLLAYGLSSSGSDWQEIKIRDLETGKDYAEILKWCKFSSVAWKHDNSGFFYNRFPEEGTVAKQDRNNYNRVYWHKLGSSQSEDKLVYERSDEKELGFSPGISEDGKYLFLYIYHGTNPQNRIYYREVDSEGPFIRLLDEADANYVPIGNVDSVVYFRTDLQAPKRRIIAIDLKKPERENWREIIPETDDVISFLTMVNNQLVVAYMHDAHHQLKLFNLDGSFVKEIELPTIGSITTLTGKKNDTEMFVGFASFLYPNTIFRYDFKTGKLEQFHETELDFNPSDYTTRQVFYPSKDGTRVPMFITHKKGLDLNGDNPLWLYGYGGFNISMTPRFSSTRLLWLESGGVYAVANLRGGSEYGEEWHSAGILARKQNVFDDFISAAEWLIENKYTNPSRIVINGGSNGGLLVAACMTQRPDLFGAVVCQVPVIDMLRYHKFTVGRYWVSDYGNAEKYPEHFQFLYAYSPLHNVKQGAAHPATIITAADTDDRVVPAHAKKFAATLQTKDAGANPILLRIETRAGHGRGKPISKIIEEQSDIYAFVFKQFAMNGLTAKQIN